MSEQPGYQNILVERRGAVGIITLNRPAALNALNAALIAELAAALDDLEDDAAIGAIVLTGNEKAFAAGADVKEMVAKSYPEIYCEDFITRGLGAGRAVPQAGHRGGRRVCARRRLRDRDDVRHRHRRRHGAVRPAGDHARHDPGAGGTQRLTRFVGKAKAMDLCLTGRMMDAAEAERAGLVSRIVPAAELLSEAVKIAERIAGNVSSDRDDGQGSGQPRL